MRLGETLLLWKSKDKKCCLYKTPYVTAPIWVLGDIIVKFSALRATSYRHTYKNWTFFGSRVTHFWRDPSHHIETPMWNFYKKVYEQKWYRKGLLTWGVLRRVPSSVSASRLRSNTLSWAKHLRNPEDQDDHKKWMLSNYPRLTCVTSTVLLRSWVYSRWKIWCPSGLTSSHMANEKGTLRNLLQRVLLWERFALSNWMKCKEPTGKWTCAKSAWEVVQKLLSDKQQSAFIHKVGNPLGIPCPSCTALT